MRVMAMEGEFTGLHVAFEELEPGDLAQAVAFARFAGFNVTEAADEADLLVAGNGGAGKGRAAMVTDWDGFKGMVG